MAYFFLLLVLIAAYVFSVYTMKYFPDKGWVNLIFCVVVFLFYVALSITIYLDVGFYDWNFQNVLPVANISPFMFATLPLTYLFPKKIRKRFYLLISLLSVGMLLSVVYNCTYNAVINYKFHIHFAYDYAAHIVLSLFGVCLIKSKQVDLKVKDCVISGLIIVGIVTIMLVLNLIFDTAFFGLSLNGKHNIYNLVLVENSYLSAGIYYLGLSCVLLMGYVYCKVLNKWLYNEKYKKCNTL